jgi:predicted outer membrane protein
MAAEATANVNALFTASAAAFDVTYMDMQVTMHAKVLSLVDTTLLPMTTNAALKAQVTKMHEIVGAHLAAAQQLRAVLSGDGGVSDGGGTSDAGTADAGASDAGASDAAGG